MKITQSLVLLATFLSLSNVLLAKQFTWDRPLVDCVSKCPLDYSLRNHSTCIKACFENRKVSDDDDEDEAVEKTKINPEAAWKKYRETMISALTRSSDVSKSTIQVLTVPFEATWDENPEQFTNLCDAVPFASGFYEPSGYKIREQYRDFVNNINRARENQVSSPSDKAELEKWSQIHSDLSQQLFPAQLACAKQFKESNTKLSYVEYEKQCTQYQNIKKKMDDANTWIEWHSAFAYGLDYASLVQSRMQCKAVSAMGYSEVGGTLADFRAAAARGETNSLSVNFSLQTGNRVSESYDKFVQGMKRPSSLNGSMFSLMSGPTASGLTTTIDKFNMKISFKSWKKIRISPGSWFSMDVIEKFRNGPFIHQQSLLFGKNGSMSLMPTAVYVAVKPAVEMTVNKQDSFNFNKSVNEGKSGFFSSRSVTAEINTKYVSEDTYKVTVKSNSVVPQVIAIEFAQL